MSADVRYLTTPGLSTFEESAEWYEVATDGHFWFEWRFAALLAALRDAGVPLGEGVRALDVGCGTGVFMRQMEGRSGWSVDGADLNEGALAEVRPGRGAALYYDISEKRPELGGRYDVVTVLDVIEHVPDPTGFVADGLFHLRSGGHLVVNVPALDSLKSPFDDAVGHLRRYVKGTLRAELEPLGIEALDCRYWGMTMLPVLAARTALYRLRKPSEGTIRRGLEPPGRLVDGVLRSLSKLETRFLPRPPLGTSLLFLGRKA
jgi:2-polyprenyl-3-methyl-5-hydroxy-6-metoxy-1,4-benzoquinol methylase